MQGSLFSAYFLDDGITLQPEWASETEAYEPLRARIAELIADFAGRASPSEANTERDLIDPILALLGWSFSVQEKASAVGRSDVPDYLLFRDATAKAAAMRVARPVERYAHGATLVEAKAWQLPLDGTEAGQAGAPSTQMLRYLGTVGVQSGDAIRFGILTNGRLWRLYDNKARSRLEGFVEIDLMEAAGRLVPADGPRPDHATHVLRTFLSLFSAQAFRVDAGGRTGIERAVEASRNFEARVTEALADTVFARVFPDLADALARHDPRRVDTPAYFADLRDAALTWLYRLLFTLYAEDRDLLPTRTRSDGLRAIREAVADAVDRGEKPSARRTNHDGNLRAIWTQIDQGDAGIGLPPYNGGLFRSGRSPLLDRSLIPDAEFAPLLDALSRERIGERPRLINYRDLNVQHLGSVYERLLEFDVLLDVDRIVTRPQTFARKTSGSYYTPEELVLLVIRRTVGPLLEERRRAFADAVEDRERRDQDSAYRLPWLQRSDPASAFLTLRICDPAMGSGHFLVSLVDYLADEVLVATRDAAEAVEGYRSPLLDRLATIRTRILEQARANGWAVNEAQLIDRQLVRRIILKRVIHGVDKNPMAVELAKLSLWLHTFTVGAPLSFLDHHLRCGDSLFGEWVITGMARLERGGLYKRRELDMAVRAIGGIAHVEDLTDADIAEVHESADSFAEARAHIAPLERFFDLLQGYRWIEGSAEDALKQAKGLEKASVRTADPEESLRLTRAAWDLKRRGRALDVLLEGELGPPDAVLDQCYGRIGEVAPVHAGDDPALAPLVRAATIAQVSNFLHWELAFPTVWQDWLSPSRRSGGFDAVIGNPPWDRLKMQEVEWFAARAPAIAHATRASDRARMIRDLADGDAQLGAQFAHASEMAALAARMANLKAEKGGQYPLLGGGDVNLYSLFVERAGQLVKPGGIVGLLTPSGIAGDLGASAFFRSISTTGRLGALLDYANRPNTGAEPFFPDVDSRFKFCAIIFGRSERQFDAADCGFFLRTTTEAGLAAATFPLTPADFVAVNPNTGTAPVFRTPRDADLTTAIYARLPVLVDRRFDPPRRPWPVRYLRMFDMTNDSNLFHTSAELEAEGWYPVAGGRWRRGEAEAVPLYEGKMVQAFDHRAASVIVNPENLKRPAQPVDAGLGQHQRADWLPNPQFYVDRKEVDKQLASEWNIAFKAVTAPTNMRTMIAGLLPVSGVGNSMGMIVTDANDRPLIYANLNAFVLDFIARQKVQGQNLNWFIVEQLPVIPPSAYDRAFGARTAREIVAREVLHLTYTAHDMMPFARDMFRAFPELEAAWQSHAVGQAAPAGRHSAVPGTASAVPGPHAWDDADRRQRRARLDALYFHLYGLDHDDAAYILSTFPIVRRQDEATFGGRFVTRDLILAQMAALAAGDPDAVIALR